MTIALALYFVPALIAALRRHHQAGAIFLTNLLLGWTLIGWVVALIWSATAVQRPIMAGPVFLTEQQPLVRACMIGLAVMLALAAWFFIWRLSL